MRAVVYRLVGDDVDDVMQSAYVRAFRGWPTFAGRSAPSTWLYSIAVRTALDHLRARQRAVRSVSRLTNAAAVEDAAVTASESVDLARALQLLPAEQRVVLLLIDGQGFSHDDAATTLGVPVGTIGSRLSRARAAMRDALRGGPS